MVEKAGFRAADLTKQLLAFSRREISDIKPMSVNDCITNVVSLVKRTISKKITIRTELLGGVPPVNGDAAQIEQVIMNLCVNARDAVSQGGLIRIRSAIERVDGALIKKYPQVVRGDYIKLSVIDDGEGIPDEHLSRIFEPFFTSKEFGKGTGLGLSIVYGIVKSHKGFCDVTSQPGKGTSFHVYLPISQMNLEEKMRQAISRKYSFDKTVLIVDDERIITRMLSEYLTENGCTVFIAENGAEAVSLFTENKNSVDLVILDINMPVMDGKDAFELIREIKPAVKIIISTGFSIDGDTQKMFEDGASAFLQKPYSLEDVGTLLMQVFQDMNDPEEPSSGP
ncbi:response regulator [Thermodesulfobacteriota bacterium]